MAEERIDYVYSCCPEKLHGITLEAITELIVTKQIPREAVVCLECGRAYKITEKGMIALGFAPITPEQLIGFKEQKIRHVLDADKPTIKITNDDLDMFTCNNCHEPTFHQGTWEEKQNIIEVFNDLAAKLQYKDKEEFILRLHASSDLTICKECFIKQHAHNNIG